MPHSCGRTYLNHRSRSLTWNGAPPVEPARPVPTHEEIAALAYSYWEAGGRRHGSALDDWLRAERELIQPRQ